MLTQAKNYLRFRVERMLMAGTRYQLLFIALLVGLVSLVFGVLVVFLDSQIEMSEEPAEQKFESIGAAIWWAFLRLTDPGYIGDDEGFIHKTISTTVTVLGYVLFMGALIAIMTQWLHQQMRELERGLTPIFRKHHVVILGWTAQTPHIVRELIYSEGRIQRFLSSRRVRQLHLVILAEQAGPALMQELRACLGDRFNERQFTIRYGTPLRTESLRRVAVMDASVIILPGQDLGEDAAATSDATAFKALLSLSQFGAHEHLSHFPLLVGELFDSEKALLVDDTYSGEVEMLASTVVTSRLIAKSVRNPGMSLVLKEILSHDGNCFFVRDCVELAGASWSDIGDVFPDAIPIGLVHRENGEFIADLNPLDNPVIKAEDRLVFLASDFESTVPAGPKNADSLVMGKPIENRVSEAAKRRILILGWSRKVPTLLKEFNGYENETYEIDLISAKGIELREIELQRSGVKLDRVTFNMFEGDFTSPADLKRLGGSNYDNVICMGSDWLKSDEHSDARTILGYLLFTSIFQDSLPHLLVELMDPENESLFDERQAEIQVSPLIRGYMISQTALRRELSAVYEVLFAYAGVEIRMSPVESFELNTSEVAFSEIQKSANKRGNIALGIRQQNSESSSDSKISLNPARDSKWKLSKGDQLIILSS